MKKYQAGKPYITSKEIRYVTDVLRSGNLSLGPRYREFESKFAKLIGTRYACSVSSGTAGLHLAMIAAGLGKGDEVITSPFSFIASANAILYVGAKPVFVDIDPLTYNIDTKKIEERITKRTKAILVVHIFGQSADMTSVMQIARKHKLKVIEDACESLNATHRGKKVGTFGESAVFAFYPNKQMTTGEGGMIVTNSKNIHELCASLRNQGRTPNMQWLDHAYLGYNYRMDEMSAAVGLAQLENIRFLINERKKIARLYNHYLQKYRGVQIPLVAKGNIHTWFVYVVQILSKKTERDRLIHALAQQGIATKPYLPSIHLFEFYRKRFGYKKGDFPVSELVSSRVIALPFYIGLKKKDIGYICKTLNKLIS